VQVDGLARAQMALGHEVHIITSTAWRGPGSLSDHELGLHVHRLHASIPLDLPLHPRAIKVIKAQLKSIKPDVVHVHVGAVSQFAWGGIIAAHQLHLPVLSTVHSIWGPIARRLYGVARNLLNWHNWTALSAVSQAAAVAVRTASQSRVLVTGNGVDLAGWSTVDSRTGRRIHLVCATRFSPRKRIEALLEISRTLHRELGDSAPRFTIAGSGSRLDYARAFVTRNNLVDVVALPGRVQRSQLRDLYSSADAFIQVSVRESFGLAAIEARAAGLPVIGRSGNGFAEFVEDGVTGFLEPNDKHVMRRIKQLVADPALLENLRQNSRNTPPTQNWEYAVRAAEHGYHAAMTQRLR
jgi:glycosyltransferase involved in cell wall biosynthesis